MDEKMQKHLRTCELQEKIMECFQTILRCEEELKEIQHDDLYDSGFNTRETLWKTLALRLRLFWSNNCPNLYRDSACRGVPSLFRISAVGFA